MLLMVLLTVSLLILPSGGYAADRSELAAVLRIMPPDGAPEAFGNVVYRRLSKKKGMAPVVFQHWTHRARYTCRVCHFELPFSMRKGASQITRAAYLRGEFCGACHNGKIAFSAAEEARNCDRCHVYDSGGYQSAAFERFASSLPPADFGNRIDWAKALNTGAIKPRSFLSSDDPIPPLPEKIAKPLRLGSGNSREVVLFSHAEHMAEMDCSNCHPDIFSIKKKGTEHFSMEDNVYGLYCGACHMRIAFPMNDCHRCHPAMKSIRNVP
jgi:c(7)-type cytochrome triheme protein